MFTTLITCTELQALQQSAAPLLIVDCTADLMNPAAGLRQFLDAHIPGATHADLDHDLSAHGVADAASGGRHPLPRREVFAHWLRQIGLRTDTQVVVYGTLTDAQGQPLAQQVVQFSQASSGGYFRTPLTAHAQAAALTDAGGYFAAYLSRAFDYAVSVPSLALNKVLKLSALPQGQSSLELTFQGKLGC